MEARLGRRLYLANDVAVTVLDGKYDCRFVLAVLAQNCVPAGQRHVLVVGLEFLLGFPARVLAALEALCQVVGERGPEIGIGRHEVRVTLAGLAKRLAASQRRFLQVPERVTNREQHIAARQHVCINVSQW